MALNAADSSASSSLPSTGTDTSDRPDATARVASDRRRTGRISRRASTSASSVATTAPPRPASTSETTNGRQSPADRPDGRTTTMRPPVAVVRAA